MNADTHPGILLAYAVERLVSKIDPSTVMKDSDWPQLCRWAIAEVQDTGADIPLLNGLYYDEKSNAIAWRQP